MIKRLLYVEYNIFLLIFVGSFLIKYMLTKNQSQYFESKDCFAFLLDLIWKLTGKHNKLRSGIFGSPQGKISWSVIQSFTVFSHLILHSHLFSFWGEGTFSFFHLTHTHQNLEMCFFEGVMHPIVQPDLWKSAKTRI